MRFSSRTSRNSFDNQADIDTESGRLVLDSSKGVRYRCGLLVTALSRSSLSRSGMVVFIQKKTKNDSYSVNDTSAPLAQLKKHGIAMPNGRGRDATWSLTRKGKDLWTSLEKVSL
jgi:hypothetical protein